MDYWYLYTTTLVIKTAQHKDEMHGIAEFLSTIYAFTEFQIWGDFSEYSWLFYTKEKYKLNFF